MWHSPRISSLLTTETLAFETVLNLENERAARLTKAPEIPDNVYEGSEPFFSFFSQAQVVLATLRLSLEERIVSPTSDLATNLETVRRTFQHNGNIPGVIQDAQRISAQLQQRVQTWERAVQTHERVKRQQSGHQIQRIKAEIAGVRGKVQLAERTLAKLVITLHQMEADANEKKVKSANQKAGQAANQTEANKVDGNQIKGSSEALASDSDRLSALEKLLQPLLGPGLELKPSGAKRFVSGESAWREQAWDQSEWLLVAAWLGSPERPTQLQLWLIPKSPTVARLMMKAGGRLRLTLASPHEAEWKNPLLWELKTAASSRSPRSDSLVAFLQRIRQQRFSKTPKEFCMLHAAVGSLPASSPELRLGVAQ